MDKQRIIYLDRNENKYGPSPACLKELTNLDTKELSDYSRDFMRGIKSCLSDKIGS